MKQPNYRALIHSPADLATSLVQWATHIQEHEGITFGIPSIDKLVIPMRPGNLISFIARPGHGKTSILAYLARKEARSILQRNGQGKEVVVYVTWEQSAEELEAFFSTTDGISSTDLAWGDADLEELKRKAVKRANWPIWVIGHGIQRAGQSSFRMTPDVVLNTIETMQRDYGVKPSLMLFDYMQLIPVDSYRDRVQQVSEVPIRVKELALRIGAPAVVGVQAARKVDSYNPPIPAMNDAQWASSIEQTCDKIFSLWMPCKTHREGQLIEMGDESYKVSETLCQSLPTTETFGYLFSRMRQGKVVELRGDMREVVG
jgi:replicative DNA helicase